MVVGLVLKLYKPVLLLSSDLYLGIYGAGVYLIALIEVIDHASAFENLCAYGGHIHERYGLSALAVY